MIEIFRTNVSERAQAELVIAEIHKYASHHTANFDLDDCDRVLRVRAITGKVQCDLIIELVSNLGFSAALLE